jgi:hypothetical protein
MTEWWTYRIGDFLLFSPATYYRLFELYNRAMWPAHVLALAAGIVLCFRYQRAILPVAWVWVGWAFLYQRYATINWGAAWFAALFLIEGLLLIALRSKPTRRGVAIIAFALAVQPLIGLLAGREWAQTEFFGMTPDPTVAATLGALTARDRRNIALAIIPVLWAVVSAATMWTLKSPEAFVLPAVALTSFLRFPRTPP